MEWVALDFREPDSGILEEAHPVRRGDHRLPATPDRDRLAAARVPGVLVRLDDPRRDDQIGLLHELLRGAGDVIGRDRPKVGPHGGIAPVRIDDAHTIHDRAELVPFLRVRCRAMQTDRHDDRDLPVEDAPRIELVEERRDQHPVRRCAREIGHGDHRSRIRRLPNGVGGQILETLPAKR